jgi:hypothetical protein
MNIPQIAQGCRDTAIAAKDALSWIGDEKNAKKIMLEKPALERALRRSAFEAAKLEKAVARPMCIGVFGPSQSGKSYLVSVLARKHSTLTACFNDPQRGEVDFIKEINPSGGKEATGLVTRFSIHPNETPPGYPVALRLLTQTELVKILANSYCNEGDAEFEKALESADVELLISSLEKQALADYADQLREEDVWDLQEYFQKSLKRFEWTRKIEPFWDRIARLAPHLPHDKRAVLYSLLWGRHEPLTSLYVTLLTALSKLGFPDDAYCQMGALLPSSSSILNVDSLSGLGEQQDSTLKIVSATGTAALPRAVVTALTAELRIHSKERPWDFFEYTDLLDFPGYRSRTPLRLEKMFAEARATTMRDMFLRGKVDFLFQRYTADQELTCMLLCLRDSNLEVTSLPAVVDDWIKVTHGETPEERQGKQTFLFFVLTFFDMHLIDRAGDEGNDKRTRFEARMHASLLRPFGKTPDSWPLQWTPGQPFKNCYWVRNPNIKSEGVIEYDDFHEVQILPKKKPDLAELRSSYASVQEIQEHFSDPLRAWDEVMKLNDGGVSYLAENVAKVCLPDMKAHQVVDRLTRIRKQIADHLARHYISTDLSKRLQERMAVCREILRDVDRGLRSKRRFGSLIRGLCVDRVKLSDSLFEARTRIGSSDAKSANGDGRADRARGEPSIFDALEPGALSQAPAEPEPRFLNLGYVAVQTWTEHMHQMAENQPFARAVDIRPEMLREMVGEIAGAARRRKLAHMLATRMDGIIHVENTEAVVGKASLVCEQMLNRFVSTLGCADAGLEQRPKVTVKAGASRPVFQPAAIEYDASGIGKERAQFAFNYAVDWCAAFQQTVRENASTEDGTLQDPEQNRKLGDILERLQKPA